MRANTIPITPTEPATSDQTPAGTMLEPLVYDSSDLCSVLRISEATLHRLKAAGKLPKPLRLGGQLRWAVDEIRAWVQAGMPDRRTWEAMRAANSK